MKASRVLATVGGFFDQPQLVGASGAIMLIGNIYATLKD